MVQALNLSWVDGRLAVGGRYPMDAAAYLAKQLGIRRIVDLRVEAKDDEAVLHENGIVLLHLPTEDRCAVSLPMLSHGVRWVNAQLDEDEKVFIHCEHGIGRSALLALCVLVSRGHEPLEALEKLKTARWQVSPSPDQLNGFLNWAEQWRASHGLAFRVPQLAELFRIAYRHLGLTPVEQGG